MAGADDSILADAPAGARLARGVCRALAEHGYAALTEFTLRSGRRADVIALDAGGQIAIVEVKASLADLRGDRKWPEYLEFCDRFYFAVPAGFPREALPAEGCGLMVADAYAAEILREAPRVPLHASRRKALTLRFARVAGRRLLRLADPGPA